MKKAVKIIAIVIAAGFIVLQFFRIDKTSQPIVQVETLEAAVSVPADVSQIMVRACNNCHTNSTIFPWYANVQPVGWFLKGHIDEGRRKMNFSVWKTYEATKQRRKLAEVCEEIRSKAMPLPSYLWLHWNAQLSEAEVKVVCDWTDSERAKMPE